MFKRMTIALVGAVVLAAAIFVALPLWNSQENLPPLPSLAMMSAYAQSGGTSGSGVFPGTTFVLSTTLPSAPARATVYRQPELKPLSVAEVQRWAERFGVHGQVYRQRIPPDEKSIWRATVFDGSRQLTVTSGDWIYYTDTSLQSTFDSAAALPIQQITDIAKNFLQSHGLLDFPYRVEPVPDVKNMVRFVRLVNDSALQNGYIQVGVAPSGQVATVEYHPLILEPAGEYPIRSAQSAWEELTSGQLSSRMQYSIHHDTPNNAPSTQTKFWRPQYRPGQRVDLYGSIAVYLPADGNGAPLIKLNEFELRGNVLELSDQLSTQLHVWGTMPQDGKSLDVTGWEKDVAPLFSPFRGTIQRDGGIVLLRRDDGKTFLLPNAPDDLPDGIAVSGGGRETNRTENGYPVLDWTSMMSLPDSLPTFSQLDSVPAFQGNTVVVPIPPLQSRNVATPIPTGIDGIDEPYISPGYATPPLGANQRVDGLIGRLSATIYESADGKNRVVFAVLADKPLGAERGWIAKLRGPGLTGIEKYDALHVRVWGKFVLEGDQPTIQVERFEKAYPDERIQAWLGKLELSVIEGKSVCFFKTREEERFILANFLTTTQLGQICGTVSDWQMVMEGVVQPETLGGYRIVEMLNGHSGRYEDRMTDLKGYQLETKPQVVRPRRPLPGKAYVERVELIYYAIANPLMGFSYKPLPDTSLRVVQPLWKFTGHTEDGASFEILVQAVSDQYVK